jgi:hypothetical protein
MKYTILENASIEDLIKISELSAKASSKEVFIYEIWSLDDVIGNKPAESIRNLFLTHGTKVKQISNSPTIAPFSENNVFVNTCMQFRYIPEHSFPINEEVLIFDDTTAIYTYDGSKKLLVIQDQDYANMQKKLFLNLWESGLVPKVWFEYIPNHSLYNSIDLFIDNKQLILYPDADARQAYWDMNVAEINQFIQEIVSQHQDFYKESDYFIAFMWSFEWSKMLDLRKFNENYVDDRSGPLSECKVFMNGVQTQDFGLASGNTLLVLWYEERLRRSKRELKDYLHGESPMLPMEICNWQDYFTANHTK